VSVSESVLHRLYFDFLNEPKISDEWINNGERYVQGIWYCTICKLADINHIMHGAGAYNCVVLIRTVGEKENLVMEKVRY
jgi:hypothetical protein